MLDKEVLPVAGVVDDGADVEADATDSASGVFPGAGAGRGLVAQANPARRINVANVPRITLTADLPRFRSNDLSRADLQFSCVYILQGFR